MMNLIPASPRTTGNYFCTWDSQCDEMYMRDPSASYVPSRDAMCEDFLFGRDGLLRSFDGARGDLIVVLDDGWDVPYGARDRRLDDGGDFHSGLAPAGRKGGGLFAKQLRRRGCRMPGQDEGKLSAVPGDGRENLREAGEDL